MQASEPEPFVTSRSHFLRAPKVPAKYPNMDIMPFYGLNYNAVYMCSAKCKHGVIFSPPLNGLFFINITQMFKY